MCLIGTQASLGFRCIARHRLEAIWELEYVDATLLRTSWTSHQR